MKKPRLVLISLISLSVFTACTPPIPPDVLASYAEQEVLCANGPVGVAASSNTQSTIQAGIDLYLTSCPDAQVSIVEDLTQANLIISDGSDAEPTICPAPVLKTALMAQTSALAYFVNGLDGLVLSPAAVSGLLTGSITSWNDPLIAETNPDIELPSTAVNFLNLENLHQSEKAFISWIGELNGQDIEVSTSKMFSDYPSLVAEMQSIDGTFAILPANIIFDNALTYANLRNGEIDNLFESLSFSAAASQVKITETQNAITAELDPSVEALVDAGQTTTSLPWYGISYYDIALCTDDDSENSARTFMRFLVRLDAQGQLETYGFFPLTESLRTKVAGLIGAVLPTPSIDPSIVTE